MCLSPTLASTSGIMMVRMELANETRAPLLEAVYRCDDCKTLGRLLRNRKKKLGDSKLLFMREVRRRLFLHPLSRSVISETIMTEAMPLQARFNKAARKEAPISRDDPFELAPNLATVKRPSSSDPSSFYASKTTSMGRL